MTRRAHIFPDERTVVFWSPKVACTSILTYALAYARRIGRQQPRVLLSDPRRWLAREGLLRMGDAAADLCRDEGYRAICLLREPYDRLISAYIDKFVRHGPRPKLEFASLEVFAAEFYRTHIGDPETEPYHGLSFRRFVEIVCDTIDACDSGEANLDPHWNTQVPRSFAECGFRYDRVYSLADAAAFFDELNRLSGGLDEVVHANRTDYGSSPGTSLVDVPSIELCHIQRFDKSRFMDKALAARVATSFASDYEHLALVSLPPVRA